MIEIKSREKRLSGGGGGGGCCNKQNSNRIMSHENSEDVDCSIDASKILPFTSTLEI